MTEIRFEHVWKSYGAHVVLEDIGFTLADHEFLAVVGPSGAGKTTLLRLLLSQEVPSRGRILIDGVPIAPEPGPDRGVVFQRYSVFPHRTVLGNLMMGPEWQGAPLAGRLFGPRRRALRDRATALLDRVGLGGAAARYPQELSGGMQQRLALAQALMTRPKVLLLDEPFGALDPGTRRDMHALVLELWDEHRMTVVMVTHDLPEAFRLGTRVMAIDRPRRDPHAPERYGARIVSDLETKLRIARWSRRFETLRDAGTDGAPPALSPPLTPAPRDPGGSRRTDG